MDYQLAVNQFLSRDLITTGKDYRSVLDSWIGYDINLLVRRWGSPTDSFLRVTEIFMCLAEQTSARTRREFTSIFSKRCQTQPIRRPLKVNMVFLPCQNISL